METLNFKSTVSKTADEFRSFSFEQKKEAVLDEEKLNAFLDAGIDFKTLMESKTEKVLSLTEKMEHLTWFDIPEDEEVLMELNDLISSAKDLHSSLIRQYVSTKKLREEGIAKDELKSFKEAMDDFKECFEDLESVFFFLPAMPEFIETTKQLSLV